MADSAGLALPAITDLIMGRVTLVTSATRFVCNVVGFGDNFFQDWDVYVARKADGSGAAPQGDRVACSSYDSDSGEVVLDTAFDTASIAIGDTIIFMHPFYGENTNIIDIPSDDLKQSSDVMVTTSAAVLTKVKELAWTGKVGGARIKFDMRVQPAGGTASAVVYKNGVPVVVNPAAIPNFTIHTTALGTYATFTQDIYGLATGDLIQIYAMAAGGTTNIQNFRIYYNIYYLPSVFMTMDSVYYDQANGYAGTAPDIGTVQKPSNNYTDLMAIAAKRGIKKVTLIGDGTFAITTNFTMAIEGSPYCTITVAAGIGATILSDLKCYALTTVATATLTIYGKLICTTTVTCGGAAVTVFGDVLTGLNFTTAAGAVIMIRGKLTVGNGLTVAGADFRCQELRVINSVAMNAGNLHVYGDAQVVGGWVNTGGAAFIWGKFSNKNGGLVMNGGTLSYYGPHSETAISVNVTNVAQNLFQLGAPIQVPPNYGYVHFKMPKLRLKCADPGVETVTVTLYEEINSVETAVDFFEINAANFVNYHTLEGMFGVSQLVGDYLRVSVVASAAGPYALTGSYSYETT